MDPVFVCAGWVYELTGGYRLPFLLNGSFTALSFLVLLPLSCLACRRSQLDRRRRRSTELKQDSAAMLASQGQV